MSVAPITFHRPLIGSVSDPMWRRINYRWLIVRAPNVILGIETAYGVGGFIYNNGATPLIVAIIGAFAFDAIILGMLALSDQQLTNSRSSDAWYYILNIAAAIVAGLFGTLYHAGGAYALITLEAITRGAIFPMFGLVYSLYYHAQMKPIVLKLARESAEAEARAAAHAQQNPYKCPHCEARYPSIRARNGHQAQCRSR